MIIATNVNKSFGKLKVLDNVSLTLNKGQAISLIGPNGSGKTTFIKCLLGMVVPDAGFITFNQQNILKDWRYRSQIGYMPQIGRYPDNMTIGQTFGMMKDIRKGMNNVTDDELFYAFGLDKIQGKKMRTLSGGTRQKVSATLAFLFSPDVLILDEPTAGLDPLASEILKQKILKEKNKGKLILITSHILSDLDDIISEIVYLQDGRLQFHKSLEELKKETGQDKLSRAIAQVMKN
jgi:Cu-processing system ATP-binding protein